MKLAYELGLEDGFFLKRAATGGEMLDLTDPKVVAEISAAADAAQIENDRRKAARWRKAQLALGRNSAEKPTPLMLPFQKGKPLTFTPKAKKPV